MMFGCCRVDSFSAFSGTRLSFIFFIIEHLTFINALAFIINSFCDMIINYDVYNKLNELAKHEERRKNSYFFPQIREGVL